MEVPPKAGKVKSGIVVHHDGHRCRIWFGTEEASDGERLRGWWWCAVLDDGDGDPTGTYETRAAAEADALYAMKYW